MPSLAEPIRADRDPDTASASGIGTATIREVTGRLVAALAPERVLLFGSYAWGSPDADSDLDLYLIVADDSDPPHRIARRGHLALRGLKVPVDLVVRTRSESARNARAVSSLDYEVLQRGVPLYG
ncbi:MAG TPA: nucleotidyltransferase domain-containing protein [Lamprocystis sp. (in: g-proteobacteria)]|nr:nucleotidyltransferase domain-containing protein [Lamprocystis sp. (in: g-proteobacteria)]